MISIDVRSSGSGAVNGGHWAWTACGPLPIIRVNGNIAGCLKTLRDCWPEDGVAIIIRRAE
jgi:hypothetical protein